MAATGAEGLRAPRPVALLLSGILLIASWRLGQLFHRGEQAGTGDGAATLLLTAMAAAALWIAIGPGPRHCAVRSTVRSLVNVSGLDCRLPAGLGGVLLIAAALHAFRRWLAAGKSSSLS